MIQRLQIIRDSGVKINWIYNADIFINYSPTTSYTFTSNKAGPSKPHDLNLYMENGWNELEQSINACLKEIHIYLEENIEGSDVEKLKEEFESLTWMGKWR